MRNGRSARPRTPALEQVIDNRRPGGIGIGFRKRALSILQNYAERKAFFLN